MNPYASNPGKHHQSISSKPINTMLRFYLFMYFSVAPWDRIDNTTNFIELDSYILRSWTPRNILRFFKTHTLLCMILLNFHVKYNKHSAL